MIAVSMPTVNKKLAQKLKELRQEKSFYQIERELHISRSLLRRYEIGERVPEDATLEKLASYYNISFYDLKRCYFEDIYPKDSIGRLAVRQWVQETSE